MHWKLFKDVKSVLSNTPVLSLFDEHKELALRCNAFGWVLGACLFQVGQPIMYVSRSLTKTKFHLCSNREGVSRSCLFNGKI